MSNISGYGDNKTFRGNLPARDPYYYINASLDLSGKTGNDKIYYLNKLNDFSYLNTASFAYPNPDTFPEYYYLDDGALVGEVCLSASPELVASAQPVTLAAVVTLVARSAGGIATLTLSSSPANFGLQTGDKVLVSGINNDSGSFNTGSTYVTITVVGNTIRYSNNVGTIPFASVAPTGTPLLQTELSFQVGGAYAPSTGSDLIYTWSGPTGNVPGTVLLSELQDAQICYYGTQPTINESSLLGVNRYVALRVSGGLSSTPILSGKVAVTIKVYPRFR